MPSVFFSLTLYELMAKLHLASAINRIVTQIIIGLMGMEPVA